jgi:hypothetical protein
VEVASDLASWQLLSVGFLNIAIPTLFTLSFTLLTIFQHIDLVRADIAKQQNKFQVWSLYIHDNNLVTIESKANQK